MSALARLAQQHREDTCFEITSDSDEDRLQASIGL